MRPYRLGLWAVMATLFAVSLPALSAPVAAAAAETGWFGETLPEGMVKGDETGDYLWQKDGAHMRWVPPGEFIMGSMAGDPRADRDELPARRVWLDGYYIDREEVSWGRWKQAGFDFDENSHSRLPRPKAPDWGIVETQPVLNITWGEARAWAHWAGKELPSEAQWEKAARGTDGRTYPWGEEPPTFERAVWKDHPVAQETTAEVTCCKDGASPYGVLNLAGNIYEWCLDAYDPGFYAKAPLRNPLNDVAEGQGARRVLRGGAYVLEIEDLRSALRYRLTERDRAPYIGFRTVVPGVP